MFHYYYAKGEADKLVEPYRVVFRWGDWYVFGFCPAREDFRLYKLRRLWNLNVTDQFFTPREVPPEKEPNRSRTESMTDDYIVTAVYEPAVKYRLVEEYGPASFITREDGELLHRMGIFYPGGRPALAFELRRRRAGDSPARNGKENAFCDQKNEKSAIKHDTPLSIFCVLRSEYHNLGGTHMIDSRCGLHCTTCTYKEPCGCGGCIETNGHPFHGACPVAQCCQEKGFYHCGECPELPCELLWSYTCDPEQGDTPHGARVEQCRIWRAETKRKTVMYDEKVRALRMERQHLLTPANETEYDALYRDLQPGQNVYWNGFGQPPTLSFRADFDDLAYNKSRQLRRELIKGRFAGGNLGWILPEDLELFAALYRKPLKNATMTQQMLLERIEMSGPYTIGQLKEESGLLVKEITPALHRLQEAFLIYEDQYDGEWDRG